MIDEPVCPVCGGQSWFVLSQQRFVKGGQSATEYIAKRLTVLFDLWAPGSSEFNLEFVLCKHCGMVVFKPRPTAADLDGKYRYLAEGRSLGHGNAAPNAAAAAIARRRSRDQFVCLNGALPSQASVLDYGGGSGELMLEHMAHGYRCHVVDYNSNTYPGVVKLGDTLDDLSPEFHFDLVVCSHVLEHLADPLSVTQALSERLNAGGMLFLEVPMELWGAPPKISEPVTHVNFFSVDSMSAMVTRSGLQLNRCWYDVCIAVTGRPQLCVRALATRVPGGASARTSRNDHRATLALATGSRQEKLKQMLANPVIAKYELGRQARRASPRRLVRKLFSSRRG
jgi:hypothetical protein